MVVMEYVNQFAIFFSVNDNKELPSFTADIGKI